MEEIIAQLLAKMARKICETTFSSEWRGISELTERLKSECRATEKAILEECVKSINRTFRENKARRKEMGLVLQEKDRHREILTVLGLIDVSRDCYFDKQNGIYVYPLDELLQIEKNERMDSGVKARLVWEACEESYRKSAEHVTEGAVSRQTVRNAIISCDAETERQTDERKRVVRELHIHADEDHVHLQKPQKRKGKSSQAVPLVTVTEGSRAVSARRNETIRPMHFVDEDFDSARLWKSVEGYLMEAYDMKEVEKIYLHADGGAWIRKGLDDYPNVIPVMDGYHAEKEIRRIDSLFPRRNVGQRLRGILRRNDPEKAQILIDSLESSLEDTSEQEKLAAFAYYLKNNWDALARRYQGGLPGSCTEGLVSHVLSERFSRNPMGWSREVLGKLSKVRVFRLNGGDMRAIFSSAPRNIRFAKQYEEYLSGALAEKLDWSIFEKPLPVFDTGSGTQRLIRMIGQAG
ncbi:MAG: ISLre2 family transposase [Lachnospiraceae bacterium]|nr:ISLre2 family transposase [Lachnospiraceae bacterium]